MAIYKVFRWYRINGHSTLVASQLLCISFAGPYYHELTLALIHFTDLTQVL